MVQNNIGSSKTDIFEVFVFFFVYFFLYDIGFLKNQCWVVYVNFSFIKIDVNIDTFNVGGFNIC